MHYFTLIAYLFFHKLFNLPTAKSAKMLENNEKVCKHPAKSYNAGK